MAKDSEQFKKIIEDCIRDYKIAKGKDFTKLDRKWIRAWMQINWQIFKISGNFYRMVKNAISNPDREDHDLNEGFGSGVKKTKAKAIDDAISNFDKELTRAEFAEALKSMIPKEIVGYITFDRKRYNDPKETDLSSTKAEWLGDTATDPYVMIWRVGHTGFSICLYPSPDGFDIGMPCVEMRYYHLAGIEQRGVLFEESKRLQNLKVNAIAYPLTTSVLSEIKSFFDFTIKNAEFFRTFSNVSDPKISSHRTNLSMQEIKSAVIEWNKKKQEHVDEGFAAQVKSKSNQERLHDAIESGEVGGFVFEDPELNRVFREYFKIVGDNDEGRFTLDDIADLTDLKVAIPTRENEMIHRGFSNPFVYASRTSDEWRCRAKKFNELKYFKGLRDYETKKSAIPEGAFDHSTIEEVTIPDNIQMICRRAFRACPIEHIKTPSHLTIIEEQAFADCQRLIDVDMSDSVLLRRIGPNAFWNCRMIQKLVFPKNVAIINKYAFKECYSLREIVLTSKKPPRIYPETFRLTNKTMSAYPIYVPKESYESYVNAWPEYKDRIRVIDSLRESFSQSVKDNAREQSVAEIASEMIPLSADLFFERLIDEVSDCGWKINETHTSDWENLLVSKKIKGELAKPGHAYLVDQKVALSTTSYGNPSNVVDFCFENYNRQGIEMHEVVVFDNQFKDNKAFWSMRNSIGGFIFPPKLRDLGPGNQNEYPCNERTLKVLVEYIRWIFMDPDTRNMNKHLIK